MAPKLYISARASTSREDNPCSGDMKSTVPMIDVVPVSIDTFSSFSLELIFAKPMSSIFTLPFVSNNRFAGLMSR